MYEEILNNAPEVSKIMDILSHEKRLAMLCFISEKQRNISQLMELLNISQSLASQFALKMKDLWVLKSKKIGKEVFYTLEDPKTLELIKALKTIYC